MKKIFSSNQVVRSVVVFASLVAFATTVSAGPIYVVRESDGTIRFTDRKPGKNGPVQVFRSGSGGGSFARYSVKDTGGFFRSSFSGGRFEDAKVRAKKYESVIRQAAASHDLDPALVKAVIHAESAFNPRAISRAGAVGLMQLMPGTARSLGVRAHVPEENIRGGARHLSRLIQSFNGNVPLALAAYNAGEVAVRRYRGVPPYDETRTYVQRVLALKKQYALARG